MPKLLSAVIPGAAARQHIRLQAGIHARPWQPPPAFQRWQAAPDGTWPAPGHAIRARSCTRPTGPVVFGDPEGYERMTGTWSRIAGAAFLDWIDARPGLNWVEPGCGTGAFTRLVVERCAPASIEAFDPSPQQIAYARRLATGTSARYAPGDLAASPHPDARFDVAVLALVLPYLHAPARGVAGMVRMLVPGGMACSYCWEAGCAPLTPLAIAMKQVGFPGPVAPSPSVCTTDALHRLWTDAGLREVRTLALAVQRRFDAFEPFWQLLHRAGGDLSQHLRTLPPQARAEVKAALLAELRGRSWLADSGALVCFARAVAVRGYAA